MQLKKSIHTIKQPISLADSKTKRPDPEVPEKKPRRRFTSLYKARILSEIDACAHTGDVGSLLRREGLYSSKITYWRCQRRDEVLKGSPPRREEKKRESLPEAKRIAVLELENRRFARKLQPAEMIIDVQ